MQYSQLDRKKPVFVAGHNGMVGSAIVRRLTEAGFENILTADRSEVDLRSQSAVNAWFSANKPEYVYLAAGTVGGIMANSTRQAEFLYDNLMIHATVVESARLNGVTKLLYLGSSCIYPRLSEQPISEDSLLQGPLEPTNEGYAIAKIAGIKLCQFYAQQYGCDFITAMPTNLYGPNDNYDLENSHVLPALIRRFHDAKQSGDETVTVCGSGSPKREFLHVDDLADACLFLMANYSGTEHINVGTGSDVSIAKLAHIVRQIVYPDVEIEFDTDKPDGMPRKLLDVSKLSELGWHSTVDLEPGIKHAYDWFNDNFSDVRGIN